MKAKSHTSFGEPRYRQHEGWPTLVRAQPIILPSVLRLSCKDVTAELLGGHAAHVAWVFVACHCASCAAQSSSPTRAAHGGRGRVRTSSFGRGAAATATHSVGPYFCLEDWYLHAHGPDWQVPDSFRSSDAADELVKAGVRVLDWTMTTGATPPRSGAQQGGGLRQVLMPVARNAAAGDDVQPPGVPLRDWIPAFMQLQLSAAAGRGGAQGGSSSPTPAPRLVGQSVQVLWWNEPVQAASPTERAAGKGAGFGVWYSGRIRSANMQTGLLKIKYSDGDEGEVAMGINFLHFASEPPSHGAPARLLGPLPAPVPLPPPPQQQPPSSRPSSAAQQSTPAPLLLPPPLPASARKGSSSSLPTSAAADAVLPGSSNAGGGGGGGGSGKINGIEEARKRGDSGSSGAVPSRLVRAPTHRRQTSGGSGGGSGGSTAVRVVVGKVANTTCMDGAGGSEGLGAAKAVKVTSNASAGLTAGPAAEAASEVNGPKKDTGAAPAAAALGQRPPKRRKVDASTGSNPSGGGGSDKVRAGDGGGGGGSASDRKQRGDADGGVGQPPGVHSEKDQDGGCPTARQQSASPDQKVTLHGGHQGLNNAEALEVSPCGAPAPGAALTAAPSGSLPPLAPRAREGGGQPGLVLGKGHGLNQKEGSTGGVAPVASVGAEAMGAPLAPSAGASPIEPSGTAGGRGANVVGPHAADKQQEGLVDANRPTSMQQHSESAEDAAVIGGRRSLEGTETGTGTAAAGVAGPVMTSAAAAAVLPANVSETLAAVRSPVAIEVDTIASGLEHGAHEDQGLMKVAEGQVNEGQVIGSHDSSPPPPPPELTAQPQVTASEAVSAQTATAEALPADSTAAAEEPVPVKPEGPPRKRPRLLGLHGDPSVARGQGPHTDPWVANLSCGGRLPPGWRAASHSAHGGRGMAGGVGKAGVGDESESRAAREQQAADLVTGGGGDGGSDNAAAAAAPPAPPPKQQRPLGAEVPVDASAATGIGGADFRQVVSGSTPAPAAPLEAATADAQQSAAAADGSSKATPPAEAVAVEPRPQEPPLRTPEASSGPITSAPTATEDVVASARASAAGATPAHSEAALEAPAPKEAAAATPVGEVVPAAGAAAAVIAVDGGGTVGVQEEGRWLLPAPPGGPETQSLRAPEPATTAAGTPVMEMEVRGRQPPKEAGMERVSGMGAAAAEGDVTREVRAPVVEATVAATATAAAAVPVGEPAATHMASAADGPSVTPPSANGEPPGPTFTSIMASLTVTLTSLVSAVSAPTRPNGTPLSDNMMLLPAPPEPSVSGTTQAAALQSSSAEAPAAVAVAEGSMRDMTTQQAVINPIAPEPPTNQDPPHTPRPAQGGPPVASTTTDVVAHPAPGAPGLPPTAGPWQVVMAGTLAEQEDVSDAEAICVTVRQPSPMMTVKALEPQTSRGEGKVSRSPCVPSTSGEGASAAVGGRALGITNPNVEETPPVALAAGLPGPSAAASVLAETAPGTGLQAEQPAGPQLVPLPPHHQAQQLEKQPRPQQQPQQQTQPQQRAPPAAAASEPDPSPQGQPDPRTRQAPGPVAEHDHAHNTTQGNANAQQYHLADARVLRGVSAGGAALMAEVQPPPLPPGVAVASTGEDVYLSILVDADPTSPSEPYCLDLSYLYDTLHGPHVGVGPSGSAMEAVVVTAVPVEVAEVFPGGELVGAALATEETVGAGAGVTAPLENQVAPSAMGGVALSPMEAAAAAQFTSAPMMNLLREALAEPPAAPPMLAMPAPPPPPPPLPQSWEAAAAAAAAAAVELYSTDLVHNVDNDVAVSLGMSLAADILAGLGNLTGGRPSATAASTEIHAHDAGAAVRARVRGSSGGSGRGRAASAGSAGGNAGRAASAHGGGGRRGSRSSGRAVSPNNPLHMLANAAETFMPSMPSATHHHPAPGEAGATTTNGGIRQSASDGSGGRLGRGVVGPSGTPVGPSGGGGGGGDDGLPGRRFHFTPPEGVLPPAELSVGVQQAWYAWWLIATALGHRAQAAQVLVAARGRARDLEANFQGTMLALCADAGCLPLHWRVSEVQLIHSAYVTMHGVREADIDELAHKILQLLSLLLEAAAEEEAAARSNPQQHPQHPLHPQHDNQHQSQQGHQSALPQPTPPPPPTTTQQQPYLPDQHHGQYQQQQRPAAAAATGAGGQSDAAVAVAAALAPAAVLPGGALPQGPGLKVEEVWSVLSECALHCAKLLRRFREICSRFPNQPPSPDQLRALPPLPPLPTFLMLGAAAQDKRLLKRAARMKSGAGPTTAAAAASLGSCAPTGIAGAAGALPAAAAAARGATTPQEGPVGGVGLEEPVGQRPGDGGSGGGSGAVPAAADVAVMDASAAVDASGSGRGPVGGAAGSTAAVTGPSIQDRFLSTLARAEKRHVDRAVQLTSRASGLWSVHSGGSAGAGAGGGGAAATSQRQQLPPQPQPPQWRAQQQQQLQLHQLHTHYHHQQHHHHQQQQQQLLQQQPQQPQQPQQALPAPVRQHGSNTPHTTPPPPLLRPPTVPFTAPAAPANHPTATSAPGAAAAYHKRGSPAWCPNGTNQLYDLLLRAGRRSFPPAAAAAAAAAMPTAQSGTQGLDAAIHAAASAAAAVSRAPAPTRTPAVPSTTAALQQSPTQSPPLPLSPLQSGTPAGQLPAPVPEPSSHPAPSTAPAAAAAAQQVAHADASANPSRGTTAHATATDTTATAHRNAPPPSGASAPASSPSPLADNSCTMATGTAGGHLPPSPPRLPPPPPPLSADSRPSRQRTLIPRAVLAAARAAVSRPEWLASYTAHIGSAASSPPSNDENRPRRGVDDSLGGQAAANTGAVGEASPTRSRANVDSTPAVIRTTCSAVGRVDGGVVGGVDGEVEVLALPAPEAVRGMIPHWIRTSVATLMERHLLGPTATGTAAPPAAVPCGGDAAAYKDRGAAKGGASGPTAAGVESSSLAAGPSVDGGAAATAEHGQTGAVQTNASKSEARGQEGGQAGRIHEDVLLSTRAQVLRRVLAVWTALPTSRQRAAYYVACCVARTAPEGLGPAAAVEGLVRMLEAVDAAAGKGRAGAVEGGYATTLGGVEVGVGEGGGMELGAAGAAGAGGGHNMPRRLGNEAVLGATESGV